MDRSEQLDYKPASLFVIEHIVHKYACPCCSRARQQGSRAMPAAQAVGSEGTEPMTTPAQPPSPGPAPIEPASQTSDATASVPKPPAGVIAASKPALPIARGLPGPGLLAHLIVSKYVDHLPLHRLESIYERQGLFLPRSTLCDWLLACSGLLRPL
jgi:transposase